MSPERAETIALLALGWLVSNEELSPVFLGSTGAAAEDLRARASDPAFLASVLEFLTMDDAWVMGFCDASDLPYEAPLQAHYALPGAEHVHWT
ncbi:DUF3572 domain-containing protein [Roseisalinus antarcticus]|uniref:DUF3572 domain-containing protein n=1 Tax=Roseisalinus antarcticus TaxID=254357 RepID=A0A1Y5S2I8_9RHOB|nr:DUF3572 domain-containing protein [Roseisalinus antarcticus]SLN28182.1 hypothetical protein ROA7023_00941 [Roseisalinus antarcticus]